MSAVVAFPYRTILEDHCTFAEWERFDKHDATEPVGEQIKGWDYDSLMDFGRSVELQPKSIIEHLGIANSNTKLSLHVSAETGPTSYRWTVYRADIPISKNWQHDIRFVLNSLHLAQRVSLATEILLGNTNANPKAFAPHSLGSRLFRDSRIVQLEGSLGRFPMEMIDFSKGLPFLQGPNSLWYLDWDPSRPESQFLGTVLLYINSGHPEVSNLIQAAEPTVLSILRCDVIRTMCQALLQNDEFISSYAEYETDTVGGQVREWLMLAFANEKPNLLRSKLDNSPGRFEARIQSAFS